MPPSLCFLGISDSTWAFINSFADWFSALGTIAAVVTSLYLARNQSKSKLRASIGHRLWVTPGVPGDRPEYICINVVNIGARNARITNLGGRVGYFKKQHFVFFSFVNGISSKLPVEIEPGQDATWFFPYKMESTLTWPEYIVNDVTKWKFSLSSVKFFVYTSVGNRFSARIDKGLMQMFEEARKKNREKKVQTEGTRP